LTFTFISLTLLHCFATLTLCFNAPLQQQQEVLLAETENAYNPIPNPDGTLIAYVRTGWQREGGTGGSGRSNLRTDVKVMKADGTLLTAIPLADAFLLGWSSDGRNLICYRDSRYFLLSVDGRGIVRGQIPIKDGDINRTERVSYLSDIDSVIWIQNGDTGAVIRTPRDQIAQYPGGLGEMIIPSPDGRYIAVTGAWKSHLRVYDRHTSSWSDLGEVMIHPNSNWDYIKPSWNPWFRDSSRLVFISGSSIVISSPDGQQRQVLTDVGSKAGLAVASPDGEYIAYVTFEEGPMNLRPDLKFWGGTTLWGIPATPGAKPYPVTGKDQDTTYCLNWLNNRRLIFDRIADTPLYNKARLWQVEVSR
jgi:Tol biopolymer transport system component